MRDELNTTRGDRASKAEVLARLDEAHFALVAAADALGRRFGSCAQGGSRCTP